jgi:CRP-like cAMP-binding protein
MVVEAAFLKSIPYFAKLGQDDLDLVRKLVFENNVERGDLIVIEGEPAEALYIVRSGALKTFRTSVDGKEQVISILRPGDTFNDVAIFDNGPNLTGVRAMGPGSVCGVVKEDLQAFLNTHPQIMLSGLSLLSTQIRYLVALIDDLSFKPVVARLAKVLIENLGNGSASPQRITQQDMAGITGTAREVIGRSLKALERSGVIKFDRHRIVITNKTALMNIAGVSL